MCPGDPTGYGRQALKGFSLVFEATISDGDFVNFALPFPNNPCARSEPAGSILRLEVLNIPMFL